MKFKGEHKDDSLVHSVVSKLIFIVLLTGILYILQILSFFNHLVFTFVPCLVAHLPAVVCIIIGEFMLTSYLSYPVKQFFVKKTFNKNTIIIKFKCNIRSGVQCG